MAGLDLDRDPERPLVRMGERLSTRADIRREADDLVAALTSRQATRVLVRSDDPAILLRAIDATSRAGADLYIAHTSLPDETVEEICVEQEIHLVTSGVDAWRSAAAAAGSGHIMMMTSGTTGAPKVAAHTLQSLRNRVRAAPDTAEAVRWLLTYQPTGFAGIQVSLTAALGGGLVVAPEQRTPGGFYEAARRGRVTHVSGTPTFWRSFLMVARPSELELEQITLGGEAADQVTLDRIRAAFPKARISHTYASTEAGVVYAVHDGREGFPAEWLDRTDRPSQLRIRDGFLQIRTAGAMEGYIRGGAQPLLEDGWLATADRVEIVGDRVRVIGRDDTTINVGGSKVYPLAIEQFLLKQPGVTEARVFGAPNPISGFLVAAEIVVGADRDPGQTRQEVLAACRRDLATYQAPRILKVVDQIEVRASGKKG